MKQSGRPFAPYPAISSCAIGTWTCMSQREKRGNGGYSSGETGHLYSDSSYLMLQWDMAVTEFTLENHKVDLLKENWGKKGKEKKEFFTFSSVLRIYVGLHGPGS